MKNILKSLINEFEQKQEDNHTLHLYAEDEETSQYYYGRNVAFAEAAQMIKDILNSENPNSVSNQPDKD